MTASNTENGSDKNNAKDDRKLRKPLIEKRRRERINSCLEELKRIMVDAYSLDQSKLEKADVLEITVQHMEGLQKSHDTGSPDASRAAGLESRQRYGSGYIQCVHEVHNLLLSCPGADQSLAVRLLHHLLQTLPPVSRAQALRHSPAGGCSPASSGGQLGSLCSVRCVVSCKSPPGSPLSPPLRTPIRPRRLVLPGAPLIALPPGAEERERPLSASSSSPSSPSFLSPDLPTSSPVAPLFISPGGPSVWRPW